MVSVTEEEPFPREGARGLPRRKPDWASATDWPRQVRTPEVDFLATVTARRSATGNAVTEHDLASLLRLATMLRTRRGDGRFGEWESRNAPSAGGLHAISLLVLPVSPGPVGLYDVASHRLLSPPEPGEAIRLNRESVLGLAGVSSGVTVQLVADIERYDACYTGFESLMWRDSGALLGLLAMIATALSLRSVILGRTGSDIVKMVDMGRNWKGVGAIHFGSN